jgi:hypothetical protein
MGRCSIPRRTTVLSPSGFSLAVEQVKLRSRAVGPIPKTHPKHPPRRHVRGILASTWKPI